MKTVVRRCGSPVVWCHVFDFFFYWVDFRDGRLGTISVTLESCFTSLPNKPMIELTFKTKFILCKHIGVLL